MTQDPIDRLLMDARACEPPHALAEMEGAVMGRAAAITAQRRHTASLMGGTAIAAVAMLIGVGSAVLPDRSTPPVASVADIGLSLAPSTLLGARS